MRRKLALVLAAPLLLVGCSGDSNTVPAQRRSSASARSVGSVGSKGTELYANQVVPILKANCYRCHGGMNHRGGLNLETEAGMRRGGKTGPDVIPGDPERSLLVTLMRHQGPADHPMPMPPAPRPRVSEADIAVVARWIREGALMPPDEAKP